MTSAEKSLAEVRLRAVGIPIPDVMVTADGIGRGKPDPECYLLAAERLGVSAEDCVVFEDSPSGIQSGLRAGMRVIAVGPYVDKKLAFAVHVSDYTQMSISLDAAGDFAIEVKG